MVNKAGEKGMKFEGQSQLNSLRNPFGNGPVEFPGGGALFNWLKMNRMEKRMGDTRVMEESARY